MVRLPTAVVLVVFGRGVVCADDGYTLTEASQARVRAAARYVADHEAAFVRAAERGVRPRIVFAGGWAEACEGAAAPPPGLREGDLMLRQARAAGLDRLAELRTEVRSRSTLENLSHLVEDGLLDGHVLDGAHPLGLVSHADHLPRIRFLAGRVLGLRGAALLDVPAVGGEAPRRPWRGERGVRLASRLWFLGARDAAALRRRERAAVAAVRTIERVTRRIGRLARRPPVPPAVETAPDRPTG